MNKAVKGRGFTIVELVIVIAIISVLAAVLIPAFFGIIEKAKTNAAVREARNAYTEYMIEHADEGNAAEYVFYKTEERIVVFQNGTDMYVYETEEEALKDTFDNPETPYDESAGYSLADVVIDGLYFMQSREKTECAHLYESAVTAPTCVVGGYTTHTCSLCGDSYTDSETKPTGEHKYVNGKCVCGAEEPEKEPAVVALIGNLEDEEGYFKLFSTDNKGIYKAIIQSGNGGTSGDDTLFSYRPGQFISENIPETTGLEGIELSIDHTIGKLTDARKASREHTVNLQRTSKYELTINFNTNQWRVEFIGYIE